MRLKRKQSTIVSTKGRELDARAKVNPRSTPEASSKGGFPVQSVGGSCGIRGYGSDLSVVREGALADEAPDRHEAGEHLGLQGQ